MCRNWSVVFVLCFASAMVGAGRGAFGGSTLPTLEEEEALLKVYDRHVESVYRLEQGTELAGTAFCIDRTGRWLATATGNLSRLQADLTAVQGLTGTRYRIVRTAITPGWPVAFLQLSGEGPDPPSAVPFAFKKHEKQAVVLIGFPEFSLLSHEKNPTPTYTTGVIYSAPAEPLVRHTAPAWPSSAGAPLLACDGSFAGMQIAVSLAMRENISTMLFDAVHPLAVMTVGIGMLPHLKDVPAGTEDFLPYEGVINLERPLPPRPDDSLVRHAEQLRTEGKYTELVRFANAQVEAAPREHVWYALRANAYQRWLQVHENATPDAKRREIVTWVLTDYTRALLLQSGDPELHLQVANALIIFANATEKPSYARAALRFMDPLVTSPEMPDTHGVRAHLWGAYVHAQIVVSTRKEEALSALGRARPYLPAGHADSLAAAIRAKYPEASP